MPAPSPRIFDGHNDTLLDLHLEERGGGRSFFERSTTGHIDLPRATDSGYAGGFFAIFVPGDESVEVVETEDGYEVPYASPIDPEHATSFTEDVLADLHRIARESDDDLHVATDIETVRSCVENQDAGMAAMPHLEGAEAVNPDLSNLDELYGAGVRSIGLVWSRPNEFAHGVPFRYPESPDIGPGLTEAGRELVAACADLGIVVDCAHLNEAGFWEVDECSPNPLVVSHSAVHTLCPSTRNLTDDQLDAVAASGGVVGISLAVENLHPDGDQNTTPVSTYVDHVEYVADRVGVEHVAIGSDFDGCTIPDSVGDVTGLRAIRAGLRDRGFSEHDLRQICSENWLRVLEGTWA